MSGDIYKRNLKPDLKPDKIVVLYQVNKLSYLIGRVGKKVFGLYVRKKPTGVQELFMNRKDTQVD